MTRSSPFRRSTVPASILFLGLLAAAGGAQQAWKPAAGPLMTRFAKDVDPAAPLPEHPRPTLTRPHWVSLNGLWDYAIAPRAEASASKWDGRILVPFPVESALSGVMRAVGPDQRLWYRRTFTVPAAWPASSRVLLHFGAVDWECVVGVDGHEVGRHRGGYDGFSLDITAALAADVKEHEITVAVDDPTDGGTQPRGKQVRKPEGIWYTPTTGIWQTVWLESVPASRITAVSASADDAMKALLFDVSVNDPAAQLSVEVTVSHEKDPQTSARSSVRPFRNLRVELAAPMAWSPETPTLYGVRVRLLRGEVVLDEVESYAALRRVTLTKDDSGRARMCLNGKPYFFVGPLDQGFWPDGLYTAPTDAALRFDIERTKALGFNCARKHVKVEPERWYFWCDKLGLAVFQDMPSGDAAKEDQTARSADAALQFDGELRALINGRRAHPSIVMWVVFNEGWGQHDTAKYVERVRALDPTRLIDNASGWTDQRCGDVLDIHAYPGPAMPANDPARALVLGEFGGLGHPVPGHTWKKDGNWGYVAYPTTAALTDAYLGLADELRDLAASGLSAAIYTQTTDVEVEVNGLMTYDREPKLDEARVRAANERLFVPPPKVVTITPTSRETPVSWRYLLDAAPPAGWEGTAFDDAGWKEGPAGFGTEGTPGAVARTRWATPGIWLRRVIELKDGERPTHVLIHHDEDVEVFANGQRVFERKGYTTGYVTRPLAESARTAFVTGRNVIAVHCTQTRGGQYVDVGFGRRE